MSYGPTGEEPVLPLITTSSEQPVAVPATEGGTLAREMLHAYQEMVAFERQHMQRSLDEADAEARALRPFDLRQAESGPVDQMSWLTLAHVTEHDPAQAVAAWERLRREAGDELTSGHRAARAVEHRAWNAWERAQFLALRDAFIAEWQPAGGLERTLIDMLAQAYTQQLFWLSQLQMQAMHEGREQDEELKRDGYWQPPRVDVAAAMEQSAAMADRFNRLFLRSLRALRDLRRYGPAVVVQGSAQINVAQRQVNLNRTSRPVAGDVAGTSPVGDVDGMS